MTTANEQAALNVKVSRQLKPRLVRLAVRQTAERGEVVTISQLVRQAIEQFLPETS